MRRRSASDEPSLGTNATADVPTAPAAPSSSSNYYPMAPTASAFTRPMPTPISGRAAIQGRAQNGGISIDLDSMINDHQRSKGSSTLVRASSGNVMLYGNLGNLRAPGAVTPSRNVLDYLPKTAKEMYPPNYTTSATPNRKQQQQQGYETNARMPNADEDREPRVPAEMCRALSRRLDPEELKQMGNEEYKKGNFAEAVALYDRAILSNPDKASYWSNKAAALTGLGKLIEAVEECREAVRIDPSYHRAHHRLGTLYLR